MKLLYTLLALIIAFVASPSYSQVAINTDGSVPHASAVLDIKSASKGILVPRMSTSEREALAGPATGLLVYDSTQKTLYMFDGHQWLGFAAMTNLQRPVNNFVYGPDKQDTLLIGYSVSLWEQFAAIGAPYKRMGAVYTGGVYIYRNIGGIWQYVTTLTPTGNNEGSMYGASVNLKGNHLIVGAPQHKNGASQKVGAAYIYQFNGSSWVLQQTLFGTTLDREFGATVAINQFGNYAAIGEPRANVSGFSNAGLVRIYHKPVSTFVLQASLQDPNPVTGERFGTALALSPNGTYALVGAPRKTVSGHIDNGYIGQFIRNGSSWSQQNTYTPPSENYQRIGEMVDISDTHALFSIGGKKEIKYLTPLNAGWGGYDPPPLPENINGLAIDPSTGTPYIFAGNAIYQGSSSPVKIKTLGIDQTNFSNPSLFSVFNKQYVVGIPSANMEQPFVGAAYFGINQY